MEVYSVFLISYLLIGAVMMYELARQRPLESMPAILLLTAIGIVVSSKGNNAMLYTHAIAPLGLLGAFYLFRSAVRVFALEFLANKFDRFAKFDLDDADVLSIGAILFLLSAHTEIINLYIVVFLAFSLTSKQIEYRFGARAVVPAMFIAPSLPIIGIIASLS